MRLDELVSSIPDVEVFGPCGRMVTAVDEDSRRVMSGGLFVAVPGFTVDGHDYVQLARARGAVAVVVQRGRLPRPADWDADACTWIEVDDTRWALSAFAAAWHHHPARDMRVIGVTGTDGKTTTSTMIAHLLDGGSRRSGLLSTARFKVADRVEPNSSRQTTLEPLDVHAMLARMRDAGVTHAVVESSSHGLALRKLDHCEFDAAVYTTITEDHLDFHRTRTAYLEAKARLLDLVADRTHKPSPGVAVLNADDASFDVLRAHARVDVLTYSLERSADLRGEVIEATPAGNRVRLSGRWGEAVAWVPMPAPFNVANALAALTTALHCGVGLTEACEAMRGFSGVPGRMVTVDRGQPFTVLVDYAHTEFSLRKLLTVLRPLCAGRLIVVFGSAGEQSRERRAGLGCVAAELADAAVLTSEDPRFEDPDQIIADIAAAMRACGREEGRDFHRITDRREAIRTAFELARPGDLVALTGKGHEQSIIVGHDKIPWDEQSVAEEELERLTGQVPRGGADVRR